MLEDDLHALLQTLQPRVYRRTAPAGTAMPYVTWQALGGRPLWHLDNTPASQRFARIQVSLWHDRPRDADLMMRAIEELLCTASVFQCRPESEAIDTTDELGAAMGRLQTFMILGRR